MAIQKDIRGTTPTYSFVLRDDSNDIVDPATLKSIEVKIYNLKSDTEVASFLWTLAVPGTELVLSSTDVQFTFTEAQTNSAESGDNRIEIWLTDTEDIVDCKTGILNEFIDAKDAV